MRKDNKTSTISELLNSKTFKDIMKGDKLAFVMKQSTVFSFWNNIVGSKFVNLTKPYSIKYSKLYVSTKSPVVAQELSLYKNKIIRNINSYSMPLGIEIKDIVFNYKNFTIQAPNAAKTKEDKPEWINNSDLSDIVLDENVERKIKENIDKIKFLNEGQKEKFIEKILTTYKARHLQEK